MLSRVNILVMCSAILWASAFAVCPDNWKQENCLGSSGNLGKGVVVEPYTQEKIVWEKNLQSHSHYTINPSTTALFVIDPQEVYSKCPEKLSVEDLVKSPTAEDFKGHSPLCCEQFFEAVANQNKIAAAARSRNMPVFVHAHVYRDFSDDGKPTNCGRLCDFDILGWSGWPEAWNLWNAALPWHKPVFAPETPGGFEADTQRDFYCEKSVFSGMTDKVVNKLIEQKIDTIIVTGFMTQYCSVTTSRHAHDLGFKVIFVQDANDGPMLQQFVTGTDENHLVPFYLGIAVADVTSTEEVLKQLELPDGEL